jgi:hypothetical protein
MLPKRSTDQPVSGITLAGATPLRQPRGRLEEAFELVEVVVHFVLDCPPGERA